MRPRRGLLALGFLLMAVNRVSGLVLPYSTKFLIDSVIAKHRVELLKKYSTLGPEQARRALTQIFGIENSLKAQTGEYEGLLDKNLYAKKQAEENELRDRVNANPEWKSQYGWAWDSIAAAIERSKARSKEINYRGLTGRLASLAMSIVRLPIELKKPNGERLPQFQDSRIQQTRFQLASPAPIYADLEELQLADRLKDAFEQLGADDPFIKAVMDGKTPEAAAKELVGKTKLADPKFRKELIDGGEAVIAKSDDPMIVAARLLAPMEDESRKWTEANVSSILSAANEKIGKARFAVYGKSAYPDATFTLRLSYGPVVGYPMNGTKAPALTTLYGLYDRAYSFGNKGDFELPERYIKGVKNLDLTTPCNFVSSSDIIGGNSGSPTIDKNGDIVGLIFDGNIESLPGRFLYSEEKNRAVSVHTGAIIECMRKLYNASAIADELEGKTK
jgi:hypothetical protein